MQQSENPLNRLSAVNSQDVSMAVADRVGSMPAAMVSSAVADNVTSMPTAMSVDEAVRAAQEVARSVNVGGSDKSSGLPRPQVKIRDSPRE